MSVVSLSFPKCLRFNLPVLGVAVALLLFQTPLYASENLSLLEQALENVRATGLYFRVDLSLEVFNATDEVPTVLLNTTTPVTAPITSTGSTTTGTPGTVIGAGSVINVGVNVLSITNSSSDTIYTTNTNYGVLGGSSSPVPVVP